MNKLTQADLTLEQATHATACIAVPSEQQQALLASWAISPHDTELLDAATANGIEDIRRFTTKLLLSPQFGFVRLGVVVHADKLTVQAQNALLKLTEEPPKRTKIVLFIDNEAPVLPTLLSRCVRYYGTGQKQSTTGPAFDTKNPLEQFLKAESLAKDDQLPEYVATWLHDAYAQWCLRGRPLAGVAFLEEMWNVYGALETPTNKRLLLEQLVVSSL